MFAIPDSVKPLGRRSLAKPPGKSAFPPASYQVLQTMLKFCTTFTLAHTFEKYYEEFAQISQLVFLLTYCF